MTPEIDLMFRLSGGATNYAAAVSLGGAMSVATLQTQRGIASTLIPGVRYRSGSGNAPGVGTLTYLSADVTLTWAPAGGTAGPATAVVNTGIYAVRGLHGEYITVSVVVPTLPTEDATASISISNPTNNLLEDMASDAAPVHRCVYVYNAHASDASAPITLRLVQPAASGLYMGPEPSDDPLVAQNESAAPAGVVFSKQDLSIGALAARQSKPVWLRRENTSSVGVRPSVAGALQIIV